MRGTRLAAIAGVIAAAGIAGCGSSSSSSSGTAAQSQGGAAKPVASSNGSSSGGASGYYGAGSGGAHSTASSTGTPSSGTASAAPVTISIKKAAKLGTVLDAGNKHLTVYMFEADKGGASACSGACASVWPPVTGTAKAAAGASAADVGTITRSDGTKQVTYKGHPLYYFVKDKDDGDAYGQGVHGFGANWYVLAPSGAKIDES